MYKELLIKLVSAGTISNGRTGLYKGPNSTVPSKWRIKITVYEEDVKALGFFHEHDFILILIGVH